MCGITGFIGRGDLTDLQSMTDAVGHRGPDGCGLWVDDQLPMYFGHRRLAVVDLEGGHQPMATPQRDVVVTFNGEIYNHLELRRQLEARGHRFQTHHSDTEVLLYSYREWGTDMLEHLNGMWAFALFDRTRRTFLLSRDRFGEKPLYYLAKPGLFAFASELTSLTRHSGINPEMSERSLQKYYAYGYVPSPLSIYEGIYKLGAGSFLVYSYPTEQVSHKKYWRFRLQPTTKKPTPNMRREWEEKLVLLLRQSVRRRLMADVDLGVFLSGGIDSSLIAALAAEESPNTIMTFNIGFEEPSFDESAEAMRVAAEIGATHQTSRLSLNESLSWLPGIVEMLDEPLGDSSILPTWLVSQQARRDVKVALSGDGGDELFAGYDPFAAVGKARAYQRMVTRPLHKAITLLVGQLPVSHRYMSLDFRLKRVLTGLDQPPALWNPIWMAPVQPTELNKLFGRNVDLDDVYSEAIASWEQDPEASLFDRVLQFFTDLYLPDDILTKTDRASMMHGLEVRAPFLDVDLAEFVAQLPWSVKYKRGQRKYLLKRAARGLVPDRTIHRTKQGFGVPVGRWFFDGSLTIDSLPPAPYVRPEVVQDFSRAHRTGRQDHRLFLWSHWMLAQVAANPSIRSRSDA